MAKRKSKGLGASSKELDPTLTALFSGSAGPITAPSTSRYQELVPIKVTVTPKIAKAGEEVEGHDVEDRPADDSDNHSEDLSSISHENPSNEEDEDVEDEAARILEAVADLDSSEKGLRKRKRKQKEEDDNLEGAYLAKLQDDEEPAGKRFKNENVDKVSANGLAEEDGKEAEDGSAEGEDLIHESLKVNPSGDEVEKANRTAFLSNVSIEAITSSKAKKTLMAHLSSVLDKSTTPPQSIESIRFRSTAYSSGFKRASFAQKSVMDSTTNSTNAYVVYNTPAAMKAAAAKLNGTVVLDRHMRVDSVAHPAPQDHHRCVFVGNLGFVNDETVLNTKIDEDGNEVTEKRKRTKQPMDVEEGLWRVFGKEAGKVESVRVVRDAATRVGKGIAYVQFYDANDVESALLLNGKKFPPMLPRELRVVRCKAPHKTARAMEAKRDKLVASSKPEKRSTKYERKATGKEKSLAGRAGKLLGRAAASQLNGIGKRLSKPERSGGVGSGANLEPVSTDGKRVRAPEEFVFEGRRASAKDGKPKDLKFKVRKSSKRKLPTGRAAIRTAKWKIAQKGGAK